MVREFAHNPGFFAVTNKRPADISFIIARLVESLAGYVSVSEMLWAMAQRIVLDLDFDDLVIYLVEGALDEDGDNRVLVQHSAYGPKCVAVKTLDQPITLKIGQGVVGRAAETGEIQRVDDTRQDTDYVEDTVFARSELAVPFMFKGELVGVIDSEHPEPHFFTDFHAEVVSLIADISAAFVVSTQITEKLEWDASHDMLTGLENRRALTREYAARVATNVQFSPFVLAFFDVNDFKSINDYFGHSGGDRFLREWGGLLSKELGKVGKAFRLGGDEFCLVFEGQDVQGVTQQCVTILDKSKTMFAWLGRGENPIFSVGLCLIDRPVIYSEAMAMADAACYEAKTRSDVDLVFYDDIAEKREQERNRQSFLRWFRQASEQSPQSGGLELYAQELFANVQEYIPCVGEGRYLEILVRMPNAQFGLSLPQAIDLIESNGLSHRLDNWVVTYTLDWLKKLEDWQRSALNTVAMNLCSKSICHAMFVEQLCEKMAALPEEIRKKLSIEVTEKLPAENLPLAAPNIRRLREFGCQVSLDDFGSGQSSFEFLRQLEVDTVKIDGSFVANAINDPHERQLLRSMLAFVHSLKLCTVAEYVRDESTHEMVKAMGVDFCQGNYLAKPLPLDWFRLNNY